MGRDECRGREAAGTRAAAAGSATRHEETTTTTTVEDLTEDSLRCILDRLAPADLLRAALACRRWRRLASRASRAHTSPLVGYIFHPTKPAMPPPMPYERQEEYAAIFVPLDAAAPDPPRLVLERTDDFAITDVRHGLVLLLPRHKPQTLLPRVLVLDPASRRRALLSAPPRGALADDDRWCRDRKVLGVAVLSRAHPSSLSFEAVLLTLDGDRPRAWVASVCDGDCTWRALPRSENVIVDFDPRWFEDRCVHAAGIIYWHICNSNRLLALDPHTLEFSFMPVPAVLGDCFEKYRIGEAHEDGRLCMAAVVDDQELQIWVRGISSSRCSDRGWALENSICMRRAFDTIPRFPQNGKMRSLYAWLSDMDYARTGKVFIQTWGFGRYSFDTETGKLERLEMDDGKEPGDPIYPYHLPWPPAFLASED